MPLSSDAIANLLVNGAVDYVLQLGVGVCDTCWNGFEVQHLESIEHDKYRCGKCGGIVTKLGDHSTPKTRTLQKIERLREADERVQKTMLLVKDAVDPEALREFNHDRVMLADAANEVEEQLTRGAA